MHSLMHNGCIFMQSSRVQCIQIQPGRRAPERKEGPRERGAALRVLCTSPVAKAWSTKPQVRGPNWADSVRSRQIFALREKSGRLRGRPGTSPGRVRGTPLCMGMQHTYAVCMQLGSYVYLRAHFYSDHILLGLSTRPAPFIECSEAIPSGKESLRYWSAVPTIKVLERY